jgi:hypothetical protein
MPQTKTNSVAFSPQANYTDWATATGRRISVPTFVDRGVSRDLRSGSPTAHQKYLYNLLIVLVQITNKIILKYSLIFHRKKLFQMDFLDDNFFCNPILFAIRTNTFSKLSKNLYNGV